MDRKLPTQLTAYAVAVLAPGVSLLARLLVGPEVMDEHALYIAFCPAVMIAAYLGGLRPGLVATVLSGAAVNYFFLEPQYSFWIETAHDVIGLAFFVLVGTFISGLCEALRRSRHRVVAGERRYAVTLASIGDAVIATDTQARVTFLNPAAEALTGWPLADAAGRQLAEVFRIINERTRQPVEDPAVKVLRSGTVVGLANHTALLARDGRETPIDDCGAPIVDEGGSIAGVVLVFRDVTERRHTEEAEADRRANERMQMAVRGSNIGIWEFDMPDGDLRHARRYYVNVWEQLGHERPDDLPDHETSMSTVHPDDRPHLEEAARRYLAGETSTFEVESRGRHKDGSDRWMLTRGAAVRVAGGKSIRFVGSSVDITELKRAEEALRESEERFRGTFENAAVGIAHEDLAGYFLRFNKKFCAILGYPPDELVGKTPSEVTHPDDLAADLANFGALTRGESPSYTMEKRFVRKDGTHVWGQLTVSLQFDAAGKPTSCIKIIQDITDRKLLEAELRQAKDVAEAANRAKDEFLANVSHEIRTPMNAILGMTELALDTPMTEDQRQYLKVVKSGAESLLGLINDLLDFSKIEAAKLELEPAPFSLRAALGDTLRVLAARAHRKGLELVSHVHPDVPDALIGDAGRLRQVLLNLVGNAIKFTETGEVVVRVKAAVPAPEAEAELHFEVRDTGIGIAPDKRETIFRAFEQEDTSTTRKYGGTGLGLTIASRLVALMGGTITVESEPGRGSTFAFTARLGRRADPPGPATSPPPVLLHNLRVLVVDDNATNRQILEGWLHGWQMEPHAVGDGLAALNALWQASAGGRPYPLILLDARMPDTDGLKLAAMIRERAELSAARIILLTSGDRPGDPARARDLRIEAHLLKPVQPDELLETITRVMNHVKGDSSPARRESVAEPVPAANPLRVLVAEDNELSASLLEQLLVRRGHHVTLAGNGRDALALAGDGDFDLLLLDVHMPEMDGFQVVEAIRSREQTTRGHLPVIALTARSRTEDRDRCLAAGMDDFLTKPIRAADLGPAIDRVVRDRPPAERPGNLIDPRVLLAACGGDAGILEKICRTLHAHLPQHLDAVKDALRNGDAGRLHDAAHLLWGTVAAFSTVTAAVALDLEERAARGRLDECGPLMEQLDRKAAELFRQVNAVSIDGLREQAGP